MKVIVAGGRDFEDYVLLSTELNIFLENESDIEIVSGGASGADYLGNKYAVFNRYNIKYFPADWANKGRTAGHIRNQQMADYADALIAFWDGKSKGTKDMIDKANKKGLKVVIVNY